MHFFHGVQAHFAVLPFAQSVFAEQTQVASCVATSLDEQFGLVGAGGAPSEKVQRP
jgi:hypothetical protein